MKKLLFILLTAFCINLPFEIMASERNYICKTVNVATFLESNDSYDRKHRNERLKDKYLISIRGDKKIFITSLDENDKPSSVTSEFNILLYDPPFIRSVYKYSFNKESIFYESFHFNEEKKEGTLMTETLLFSAMVHKIKC